MAWKMKETVPKRCPSCGRQDRFTASRNATFMFLGIETCCLASRTPFRRLLGAYPLAYVAVDFDVLGDFIKAVRLGVSGAVRGQTRGFGWNPVPTGTFAIEGPHYPRLHTWGVVVELRNGLITAMHERLEVRS